MRDNIFKILTVIIVIVFITMGIISGFNFDYFQIKTLYILGIVCLASIFYCFVVGEITGNNSQMDKLWSILPIIYSLIIVFSCEFNLRLLVMAVLITIWGVRLTSNFAMKGAYSIKFWSGQEDYRWGFLRSTKLLSNKYVWTLFDFLFISIYQNVLVLLLCLPMVACMGSHTQFNTLDLVFTLLTFSFILFEAIADKQQMFFQTNKRKMLDEGKKLNKLKEPYNLGFNTIGLWNRSRHPNYFFEQAIWIGIYLFCISAEVVKYYIFNITIIGSMLLVLLFIGSSTLGEYISSKKYPLYKEYTSKINRFLPGIRKYK